MKKSKHTTFIKSLANVYNKLYNSEYLHESEDEPIPGSSHDQKAHQDWDLDELYVASFIELIDGEYTRPPVIIGIYGDEDSAYAAIVERMDAFAKKMDKTWTLDKGAARAERIVKGSINCVVKWGVMSASVDLKSLKSLKPKAH